MVVPNMAQEAGLVREGLGTGVADEGLLSSVDTGVAVQVGYLRKPLVAHVTYSAAWFISCRGLWVVVLLTPRRGERSVYF